MKLDTSRTVLVVGGTGTIGSAVVRALLDVGAPVRALVRSGDAAACLPPGASPVRGDLRDPASLARALHGVHAAFYVSPDAADEMAMADAFVRACERSDARIVFAGVDTGGRGWLARAARRIALGSAAPHQRGKFQLAERIRRSGARPVVLALPPDVLASGASLGAVLDDRPTPPAHSRDGVAPAVASAAVRALLEPDFRSGVYPIEPRTPAAEPYVSDLAGVRERLP